MTRVWKASGLSWGLQTQGRGYGGREGKEEGVGKILAERDGVGAACSLNWSKGLSELVLEEKEKEANSGCGRAHFIILDPPVKKLTWMCRP